MSQVLAGGDERRPAWARAAGSREVPDRWRRRRRGRRTALDFLI